MSVLSENEIPMHATQTFRGCQKIKPLVRRIKWVDSGRDNITDQSIKKFGLKQKDL